MERIRPTSANGADRPTPANRPPQTAPSQTKKALGAPSLASKVLVILLILASLVFIANMTLQLTGRQTFGSAKVDNGAYQAVFLQNGQVYFGKLSNINSQYVTLEDIYYLQVNQTTEEGLQPAENQKQPQISLAKLGRELHGPQDRMFISRDQVVFWENLKDKDNSQVTKAIEDFKAQGDQNKQ